MTSFSNRPTCTLCTSVSDGRALIPRWPTCPVTRTAHRLTSRSNVTRLVPLEVNSAPVAWFPRSTAASRRRRLWGAACGPT